MHQSHAASPSEQTTPRTRTGASTWAWGLLALVPVPFFGAIGAALTIYSYLRQHHRGPLAQANALHALKWARTYLLGLAVAATLLIAAIVAGPLTGGSSSTRFQVLVLIAMTWYGCLHVVHLALTTVGTVQSSRGRVFANRLAIPWPPPRTVHS